MNEILNKCLLIDDKFMPKFYLQKPGFVCNVAGPFTKISEIFKRFEEAGGSRYVYKNEFYKACFLHNLVHGRNNKDL